MAVALGESLNTGTNTSSTLVIGEGRGDVKRPPSPWAAMAARVGGSLKLFLGHFFFEGLRDSDKKKGKDK